MRTRCPAPHVQGHRVAVLQRATAGGYSARVYDLSGALLAEQALDLANVGGLRWHPDGQRLSLFGDGQINLWDPAEAMTPVIEHDVGWANFHSWAPDGRSVVFMAHRGWDPGSPPRLYRQQQGSAELLRLPHAPGRPDFFPEFAPDGATIVFRRGVRADAAATLWTVTPDGRRATPIVRAAGVANPPLGTWSPDGRRLLYVVGADDLELGVWDRRSAATVRRTACVFSGWPAWAPDSRRVVALLAHGRVPVVVDTVTGAVAALPGLPGPCALEVAWAPCASPLVTTADGSLWVLEQRRWRLLVQGGGTVPPTPDRVTFPAADGAQVPAAVWTGAGDGPWLVWASAPDRISAPLAAVLRAGMSVLQPDDPSRLYFGGRDADDLAAAARFLVDSGRCAGHRVAVVGYSYGAFRP